MKLTKQTQQLALEGLKVAAPWIALLIVGGVIMHKFKKANPFGVFGKTKEEKKAAQKYVDEIELEIDRSKVTLSKSTLIGMASTVYNAVFGFGTTSGALESVFAQLKSNDDYRALIVAYGIRNDENMVYAIQDDVNPHSYMFLDLQELNEIMSNNGLTVRI